MRRTPYTATLGTSGPRIEGSDGWWGKFPDPFAREFGESIRKRAAEQQQSGTTDDPWCIGFFVDNELSWGRDDRDLARAALLSPATQPAKLAFKTWLEQKYATPEALNTAWGTAFASWEAFLATTDKPMINGEFHFGALDRGMFHTGLVPTGSQTERADCYAAYVESCLAHPRYVGTHWFQWRDQALTGRGDAENYQIGFLTVTDQPYPELVEAARKIGASMYQKRYAK